MREIKRLVTSDEHSVTIQVFENGEKIAEDTFPTPFACHLHAEPQLNVILQNSQKSALTSDEVSKIKELAPLPN